MGIYSDLLKCYQNMKNEYNNSQNDNYKLYLEKLLNKFYDEYLCDYSITTKMSEDEIMVEYIKLGANEKDNVLYNDYKKLLETSYKGLKGLEITLDSRLLDDKQSDFFHYECSYQLAKCDYGTFYLTSCGELSCVYIDDKIGETRNYDDIIRYYVKNDDELANAIESGKLDFSLNNWFEIHFIDNNGNYLDYFDYTDNVYGCISEGLYQFLNIITDDECIKDILKELGVE
jgi:hypothetical protein